MFSWRIVIRERFYEFQLEKKTLASWLMNVPLKGKRLILFKVKNEEIRNNERQKKRNEWKVKGNRMVNKKWMRTKETVQMNEKN